jgi:Fe-S cluster biogenesis protein NfuA
MAPSLREPLEERNALASAPTAARVRAALDDVRPGLVADGGNVELLQVEEDGTVTLTLQGACASCPAAAMTIELVIAPHLQRTVPGVSAVIAV